MVCSSVEKCGPQGFEDQSPRPGASRGRSGRSSLVPKGRGPRIGEVGGAQSHRGVYAAGGVFLRPRVGGTDSGRRLSWVGGGAWGGGAAYPAPAGKGPALRPRFRFRSGPRPSRTLTDSRLQSLRLHRGLHPPQAPSLGTAPRPPPLSRDLLGTALRRLKGQRSP